MEAKQQELANKRKEEAEKKKKMLEEKKISNPAGSKLPGKKGDDEKDDPI